ncbi:MAG: ATP-binding protein, partial [Chloroflexi bacterium]
MTFNSPAYLTALHKLISQHYSLDEFRMLCFCLEIDYDYLAGEAKPSRIHELLLVLGRNGRLPHLITTLQQERPDIDWPPVPDDFQLAESLISGEAAQAIFQQQIHGDRVQGDKIAGDKITIGNISSRAVVAVGPGATAINIQVIIKQIFAGTETLPFENVVGIQNFLTTYLGTDEKPVPFGGRDQQLKQLNDWLAQGNKQYLLLTAPAGRGKSALLVRWRQALTAVPNLSVIFIPISLRFNTNRKDTTFRYLSAQLAHLHHKKLPTGSNDQPPQFWHNLAADYLREPLPNGRQLLLILDGLDEAKWNITGDLLPSDLPATTQVLLSARFLGGEAQSPSSWLHRLGWDSSPGLVRTMTLEKLTQDGVRDVLQKMNFLMLEIAERLYKLSEGDPLLVELYVKDLQQQGETPARLMPEDLQNIQPGYKGYFDQWWLDQKKLWGDRQPWQEPLVQALLSILSIALGQITIDDIQELLLESESAHSLVIQETVSTSLSRFVLNDGREQGFVFSHPKLADYFRDERLTPREKQVWQSRFLNWGQQALAYLQAGGLAPKDVPHYLMYNYGRHLETANATVEGMLPLVSQEWMHVWRDQTGTYAGFLEDADKVLAKVQMVNETAVQQKQNAPYIGQEIAYLLCHTSITSLSSDLPPHLPALLVQDKIWTPQQAVFHANQIPDTAQRVRTLVTLLTVEESEKVFSEAKNQDLRRLIISSALQDLNHLWNQNKVNEAQLFQLQLAISPFLSPPNLKDALPLANKIQHPIWQARLLSELLPLMVRDHTQKIKIIKKIIHACSQIDDSYTSGDIPFIVPTYTAIAQNLPIEQFSVAFSQVWESENQAIREQEQVIKQSQNDPSLDAWDHRLLQRKLGELNENRTRKKRIFDHLAWQIDTHQAIEFVEMLFAYETLPKVAEKIARFALKLDDETAYNIAVRFEKKFATAHQEKREFHLHPGMISKAAEGIGIGFIALIFASKGKYQQKILALAHKYIETYGEKDYPYGKQDLWKLCELATGKLTDIKAATLIKQGKFMQQFWKGPVSGGGWGDDDGKSPVLSMHSQEIVAYLGVETLKLLFERCRENDEGDPYYTRYWYLSGSPYILPTIAEKLPDEELSLIYEIGHSRGESYGYYGYIRAATQFLARKHVPKAVILDTLQWVFSWDVSDSDLERAIARFITPDTISERYRFKEISTAMATKDLPDATIQYIVDHFDISYYGNTKGTEILLQFVQYLPDAERRSILRNMEAELFQIKDSGELNKMLKALQYKATLFVRKDMRRISKSVKIKMEPVYLLAYLKKAESNFSIFNLIPFFTDGGSWRRSIGKTFRASIPWFKISAKRLRLLRLYKHSHPVIQKQRGQLQKPVKDIYESDINFWFEKMYYKKMNLLASSKFIWTLYLLFKFILAVVMLLIVSIAALLMLPFVVLVLGGGIVLIFLESGRDWLKYLFRKNKNDLDEAQNKKDKTYKWGAIQKQIHTLNQMAEPQDREQSFVDIAKTLESIVGSFRSSGYREYIAKVKGVWSELNPEFMVDALSVLNEPYKKFNGDSVGILEYINVILPAIVSNNRVPLQVRSDFLEKSLAVRSNSFQEIYVIHLILTEIADCITSDFIPTMLGWLIKYPDALVLKELAPKIAKDKELLTQGFEIAKKIDKSVGGFFYIIALSLDMKWTAKT